MRPWERLSTRRPKSMMPNALTAYWVSTPRYTVLVVVDAGGVIRYTAPYLRRLALGQPWPHVRQILHERHGAGLRVERL
jgi:hypothetical protein